MGAQIRSDLASHSIMPYIFWILNAGTPPSPPTYIHPLLELSWVLSQGSLPEKEHIILRFYCYTNWNYICRLGITLRCLPHAVLLRCLAVRPVLLRQGLHQSPEGDSIFFFFWRSSQAVVLLKTLLNHFSFVSIHTDLLSGLSVLPCSCNSLTATSLCTTWGTEVDMASHFCTTSYSWDTWGQTILQLLYS